MDRIVSTLCPEEPEQGKAPDPESNLIGLDDLIIRTKDRRLLRLEPNAVQAIYLDGILPHWRRNDLRLRRLRELLLKARQFGFSTLIEALIFVDTLNNPNTVSVVVSKDDESTKKLFRMVKCFYDHLPPYKQPRISTKNKGEFYWPDLNSTFYTLTAGKDTGGRGDTIQNLHCSEVAFYPDAEDLMTGLLQAVPEDGNVFMETTANGLGNFYHSEWEKAVAGESTYSPRFFGWHQHPEYSWTPATDAETELAERLASKLSRKDAEKEEQILAAYNLTIGQIQWRRRKAAEPGMRSKLVQEYPINAREAFIASGNPYFDREKLDALRTDLVAGGDRSIEVEIPEEFAHLRAARDDLKIFVEPLPGRTYTIGADTAEGLTDEGDHDYSAADVIDDVTGEQVATLHARWDTWDFGILLAELGWFYNTALVAPESNNHGHAVIKAMLHGAGYPEMSDEDPSGIYLYQEYDRHAKDETRRPGWPSNQKTKFIALGDLDAAIDGDEITINDPESISELITYVRLPSGKAGGEGGSHDDRVMSLAITIAVWRAKPVRRTFSIAAGGRSSRFEL